MRWSRILAKSLNAAIASFCVARAKPQNIQIGYDAKNAESSYLHENGLAINPIHDGLKTYRESFGKKQLRSLKNK